MICGVCNAEGICKISGIDGLPHFGLRICNKGIYENFGIIMFLKRYIRRIIEWSELETKVLHTLSCYKVYYDSGKRTLLNIHLNNCKKYLWMYLD